MPTGEHRPVVGDGQLELLIRLDERVATIATELVQLKLDLRGVKSCVAGLDRWRWKVVGAASVLGLLAGILGAYVAGLF